MSRPAPSTAATAVGSAKRQKKQAARSIAERRLRDAIDVLPEGIVFLDEEGRYILWNERYAEIYKKSADLLKPGVRLADTLKIGIQRGDYPEAVGREDEWLRNRLSLLENPGVRHEQWLSNGRCILIEERKTDGGETIGLRVDITELKQREESVRLLFESNPVPLMVYDPAIERFTRLNSAAAEHFGLGEDHADGVDASLLFAPGDWEAARKTLGSTIPDGDRIWQQTGFGGQELESVLCTRQAVLNGRLSTIVCVFDVTERRRAEAQIAHMAKHDDLTGLANRRHCRELLRSLLGGAHSDCEVALLVVDLDHFKPVNDTYGHAVGDELLAQAAERMRGLVRPGTLVARLGGDEFALATSMENKEEVGELAGQIIHALAEPFYIADHTVHIGASIGIAFAHDHSDDPETLARYADLALYAGKANRGSWKVFEPSMDIAAQERIRLENDFREAVRFGHLEVHYQPLIELKSGVVDGYEALLRWNHPERGAVPPSQFIPLAEEIGLIDVVGQFVLQTACAEATQWPDDIRLAVNVSPLQFRSTNLVALTVQALAHSGLPPARLELEITEAVLLEKNPHVAATMAALRELGVGISMDDFGTGYSSLSYLLSYPFTKIKIDQSFISSIRDNPISKAVVTAIIGLGASLGMAVTAEGIEDPDILSYLKDQGCAQGQGYLFGRAMPASSVSKRETRRVA